MTAITHLTVSLREQNLQPQKSYMLDFFFPFLKMHCRIIVNIWASKGTGCFYVVRVAQQGYFAFIFIFFTNWQKWGLLLWHIVHEHLKKKKENWLLLLLLTEFAHLFQNNRGNHNFWSGSLYLRESHQLRLTLRSVKLLKITIKR